MKIEVSRPEDRTSVETWLREPGLGEIAKENRVRSVHRWNGLYVKCFKHPGLVQGVRSFLQDRAAREFRILTELRKRGVEAPEPVAWARSGRRTYLFTREIPRARVLRSVPLTRPLLLDLAKFITRIHEAGLRDDDLHIGNILLADGKLHLLDLHRAAFVDGLTRSERAESIAFAILSFYTLVSRTEVVRFIRACGADPREVTGTFRAFRERYYRDRQGRVGRNGSDFEVVNGLVLRRPYTADAARRALEAPPLEKIKEIGRRRLWRVDAKTFIKEGDGAALWYNGFGLETRGVPTPRLLARSGRRVVGEWIEGGRPLWDHFKERGVSRDFVGRLARVVRRMHLRGVYHRDLKANNVLVRGDEIYVIDPDRVDFMRDVPRAARIWNLAQLNAAVGAPVTRADRLRFFFAYAGSNRALRMDWKGWVREIMRRTVERRHVWPTCPGSSPAARRP